VSAAAARVAAPGPDAGAPLLAAEAVTRRFAGLVAVDSVSLQVSAGQIVSVIGPNGAGKTTLFNLLSGQLAPSDGTVSWQGRRIETLPPHERARLGMGRTFQIARPLIALSALENVLVGAFLRHPRYRDARERAMEALAEVGLGARAEVRASELTLSERRRLEVGRALALEPRLILLDEVMAGLNPTEVGRQIDLVRRLNARGITFLVIEHNLKVVRAFSDRVIVLDHGAKIAEGSAEQVLAEPAVITAYLGNRRT
jgi:branched-chain amino acid transport system ATP-binding protein